MRYRLLNILCCPYCGDSFKLRSFKFSITKYDVSIHSFVTSTEWERYYEKDVEEGTLKCNGCNRFYPIINFIPRILPNILSDYPDFCERYSNTLQDLMGQDFGDHLTYGLNGHQKRVRL